MKKLLLTTLFVLSMTSAVLAEERANTVAALGLSGDPHSGDNLRGSCASASRE